MFYCPPTSWVSWLWLCVIGTISNSIMACQCYRHFGQRNAERLQKPQRNMAYSDSPSHTLNYGSWFYATMISRGCSSQLAAGAVCLNPATNDRNQFQSMALALLCDSQTEKWAGEWQTWDLRFYLKQTTLVNMWWCVKTDNVVLNSYNCFSKTIHELHFIPVTTYFSCLYFFKNMHMIHIKSSELVYCLDLTKLSVLASIFSLSCSLLCFYNKLRMMKMKKLWILTCSNYWKTLIF